MRNFLINTILVFGLLLNACSLPSHKKEAQNKAVKKEVYFKPESGFPDTLKINSACAVFYQPDSLQVQKIKAVTDPGIFASNMHEFFYQQRNARMYLKKYWPGIKTIEVNNKRFLLFLKAGKTTGLIDLDKISDSHGLFVFDGKQAPLRIDMMNIETQVPDYFKDNSLQAVK